MQPSRQSQISQLQAPQSIYLLRTRNRNDYALFIPSGIFSEEPEPHIILIRSLTDDELYDLILSSGQTRLLTNDELVNLNNNIPLNENSRIRIINGYINYLESNNRVIPYNGQSIQDTMVLIRQHEEKKQFSRQRSNILGINRKNSNIIVLPGTGRIINLNFKK